MTTLVTHRDNYLNDGGHFSCATPATLVADVAAGSGR
jgi:hypothetical protein